MHLTGICTTVSLHTQRSSHVYTYFTRKGPWEALVTPCSLGEEPAKTLAHPWGFVGMPERSPLPGASLSFCPVAGSFWLGLHPCKVQVQEPERRWPRQAEPGTGCSARLPSLASYAPKEGSLESAYSATCRAGVRKTGRGHRNSGYTAVAG